jgi:hypothetical protein
LKEIFKGGEDEKEDINSYRIIIRKREDTGNW